METEDKIKTAVSTIFDSSLKTADKLDCLKAEYLSSNNGIEKQKLNRVWPLLLPNM